MKKSKSKIEFTSLDSLTEEDINNYTVKSIESYHALITQKRGHVGLAFFVAIFDGAKQIHKKIRSAYQPKNCGHLSNNETISLISAFRVFEKHGGRKTQVAHEILKNNYHIENIYKIEVAVLENKEGEDDLLLLRKIEPCTSKTIVVTHTPESAETRKVIEAFCDEKGNVDLPYEREESRIEAVTRLRNQFLSNQNKDLPF